MSYEQTWRQRLAEARDSGREGELLAKMLQLCPPNAVVAALASRDAAMVLAQSLDAPLTRPLTLLRRVATAQARLLHRHYEDSIAANNELAARGSTPSLHANAELALKLFAVRDTLAAAGVSEADRSMGNWELLSWLAAGFAALACVALLTLGSGWRAQ